MRVAHRHTDHHLLKGSAAVTVAVALGGAAGFAFWWVAAARYDAGAVGSAQELFTAVTVVACLTSMGLPVAVARFSPDRSARAEAAFRDSLVCTSVTSMIGAVLLAALGSEHLLEPVLWGGRWGAAVVLSVMLVGMALAVLVEVRLVALRSWGWVIGRVALVSAARLPLLLLHGSSTWAFLLVAGLPALSGIIGATTLLLTRTVQPAHLHRLERRAWLRFSAVNWVGLMGSQGPMFLIPLIVSLSVSSRGFAPFYIAWAITQMTFLLPHMMGQTYLAESSKDSSADERVALRLAVGLMAAVTIAAVPAGVLLGWSLGPDYEVVARLLPWLLISSIPWAVTSTYLSRARRRHADVTVVVVTGTFFITTLGAVAIAAPEYGVIGAAKAWLLANVIVAGVAWLLPLQQRSAARADRPELDLALELELELELDLEGMIP